MVAVQRTVGMFSTKIPHMYSTCLTRREEVRRMEVKREEVRREEERRGEEIQREIDPKYEQNGEYQAREGGVLLKSCSCQDLSTSTNISFFLITSYLFSRL